MNYHQPVRRLNVVFAVILLVTVIVTVGGVHLLHGYQVRHTADSMRIRGERSLEEGDKDAAEGFFTSCVQMNPKDHATDMKLAKLVAEKADAPDATYQTYLVAREVLTRVWREEQTKLDGKPDLDILRSLASVTMKLRDWSQAEKCWTTLKEKFPGEVDIQVQMGRCQIHKERFRDAIDTFEEITSSFPNAIEAYTELAYLVRNHEGNKEKAAFVMSRMIDKNPHDAEAYLARSKYRQRAANLLDGNLGEMRAAAWQDIEEAGKWVGEDAGKMMEVHLAAAELAIMEKDFQRAHRELDEVGDTDDPRLGRLRQWLARGEGRIGDAIDSLREIVKSGSASLQELYELAHLEIADGDIKNAKRRIRALQKGGVYEPFWKVLDARIMIAERKWEGAVRLLQRVRTTPELPPDTLGQIDLLLGLCFQQLGQPDRQEAAYRSAVNEAPRLLEARIALVSILLRTKKTEEALREFEQVRMALGEKEGDEEAYEVFLAECLKDPRLWQLLLQTTIAETKELPEEERDWTPLEAIVERICQQEGVKPIQKIDLQAILLTAKGDLTEASQLLTAACDEHPEMWGFWLRLANVRGDDEGPRAALAVLDRAAEKVGNTTAVQMAKANFALKLGPVGAEPILAALEEEVAGLTADRKPALLMVLAQSFDRIGNRAKADSYWQQLVEEQPDNARLRFAVFLRARDVGNGEKMAEHLKALQGSLKSEELAANAQWNYCDAAYQVWLVREGEQKSLEIAKERLRAAAEIRPRWHLIPLLLAEINLLEDGQENIDLAINNFLRAGQLGQLPSKHRQLLVQLLRQQGREAEAEQFIEEHRSENTSRAMQRQEVALALQMGKTEEALQKAREIVGDSTNPADLLWLGQTLARAGKHEEAERQLAQVVETESTNSAVWLLWIAELVATEKMEEAEDALREAQIRLPETEGTLLQAQGYTLLKDLTQAESHYKAAVRNNPQDPRILRMVAEFYLRTGRPQEAAGYYRQVLELGRRDPDKFASHVRVARRALAAILVAGSGYKGRELALELLRQNAVSGSLAASDRWQMATILAAGGNASRSEAAALLEGIRASLKPAQLAVLADLYQRTDQWAKSAKLMRDLLIESYDDAAVVEACVKVMLRQRAPIIDIESHVATLEELRPDAPQTKILRAQLLIQEGRADEAVALFHSLIPYPLPDKVEPEHLVKLRDIALMLEDLEQYAPAEKLLSALAKEDPKGYLVLASFTARRGLPGKALGYCEEAMAEMETQHILPTALAVVQPKEGDVAPELLERVDGWLKTVAEKAPDHAFVLFHEAGLRQVQGRFDEAITVYRKLIDNENLPDKDKATAWANLAYLLAAQDDRLEEALDLIGKAIDLLGPMPQLLDTRALVYLAQGESQAAIRDMEAAVADTPSALNLFHLAQAQAQAGQTATAAETLQRGRDSYQLRADRVPKIERQKYGKLLDELKEVL